MRTITTRRIATGVYQYQGYIIERMPRQGASDDENPGAGLWIWHVEGCAANDVFATKRDALAALAEYLEASR